MDIFLFIVKYTPFWAVPIFLISGFFAYTYWIKDIEPIAIFFGLIGSLCAVLTVCWILLGGPDKSVAAVFTIINNY